MPPHPAFGHSSSRLDDAVTRSTRRMTRPHRVLPSDPVTFCQDGGPPPTPGSAPLPEWQPVQLGDTEGNVPATALNVTPPLGAMLNVLVVDVVLDAASVTVS